MILRDYIEHIEINEKFKDATCLNIEDEVVKKLDKEKFIEAVLNNFEWIIEAKLTLEYEVDNYKEAYINPVLYFTAIKNKHMDKMDEDCYVNWMEDILDEFTKKYINLIQ